MGHPIINMLQGSIDLNKKTTSPLVANFRLIKESSLYSKKSFIVNYVTKNSCRPPVTYESDKVHHGLIAAHARGISLDSTIITEKFGKIDIEVSYRHERIKL